MNVYEVEVNMDNLAVNIREALINDYNDISTLCERELGYSCDERYIKLRLTNLDHNRECVYVATINDNVVGFVHVEKYEPLYIPKIGNILGLAVSSNYQRKGIGRKLLTAAEKWAKEHGLEAIRLNSNEKRTEAHAFYRTMGYVDNKKQLRFIKSFGNEE